MSMLLSIRVIKLFNDDQEAVVDIRSLHIAFFSMSQWIVLWLPSPFSIMSVSFEHTQGQLRISNGYVDRMTIRYHYEREQLNS